MKYAIVVVGYNRIDGMLRLIESLLKVDYERDIVDLIISIDNSGTDFLETEVKKIKWENGEKIIRTFHERQGLRKHILECGEYLKKYNAIAVFEDDIVVSKAFYTYMKQAVKYYYNDEKIAGISLYSHKINVNTGLPFVPEKNAKDVYFLQFAQSWGQIWMRKQWFQFIDWYEENKEENILSEDIPEFVANWPDSSWLKYHIRYCISCEKYFVYPYEGLTTCFSEIGEHCKSKVNYYQIPLMNDIEIIYKFTKMVEQSIIYDAFFEREGVGKYIGINSEDLCLDLYGEKENKVGRRFWITRKKCGYEIVNSYSLIMRPHEINIINNCEGGDIYLYDTKNRKSGVNKESDNWITVEYYYNIGISIKKIIKYIQKKIINKYIKKKGNKCQK